MIKSIQQFLTVGTKELSKTMEFFAEDPTKFAEMVYGVTKGVTELGVSIIAEELESWDELIRNSSARKQLWYIVRKDETTLLTSLGSVTYQKTLFKSKKDGHCEYLLDKYMGLESHERITEDAVAKLLEEAVESSYKKGGDRACITDESVSKEAVMNKIHELEFPLPKDFPEKKQVQYLYIDADEDHVALQYQDHKGEKKEKGKRQSVMPRLVYLYEGISDENGRNELVNPTYFGGLYEETSGVKALWSEVEGFIQRNYDTDQLKAVYINGDGANWIKSGEEYITHGRFVLDKYHMHKYIIKATGHLKDNVQNARSDLYHAIAKKDKDLVIAVFDAISNASAEDKQDAVNDSRGYILGNWAGIKRQVRSKDSQLKCSAEGHVSHIYSDRMSSRPLGWCRTGAEKMARLRIYRANHGNMLELVRYQKQALKKAAGAENDDIGLTAGKIIAMQRKQKAALGVLEGTKIYTVPLQARKILAIRDHLLGL